MVFEEKKIENFSKFFANTRVPPMCQNSDELLSHRGDPCVRKKFRKFFEIFFFKNHKFVPLKVLVSHPDDILRIGDEKFFAPKMAALFHLPSLCSGFLRAIENWFETVLRQSGDGLVAV